MLAIMERRDLKKISKSSWCNFEDMLLNNHGFKPTILNHDMLVRESFYPTRS
jgi:hypothetical protein